MAIKPVDFQIMIPRTMEVSKASNDAAQKNQTLQQQQTAAAQQQAENSIRQVYSQTRPQNAKIEERQRERNQDREQKKKNKNGEERKNDKRPVQTSTIDIKI